MEKLFLQIVIVFLTSCCGYACDFTYGASCYTLHCIEPESTNDYMTWTEMGDNCVSAYAAYLVRFTTAAEFDEVLSNVERNTCADFAIGLSRQANHDRLDASSWSWEPQAPQINWKSGEPNLVNTNDAGVMLSTMYTPMLYDVEINNGYIFTYPVGYICEGSISQPQTTSIAITLPTTNTTHNIYMDTTGYSLSDDETTSIAAINTNALLTSDGVFSTTNIATSTDAATVPPNDTTEVSDVGSSTSHMPNNVITSTSDKTTLQSVSRSPYTDHQRYIQDSIDEERKLVSNFVQRSDSPSTVSSDVYDGSIQRYSSDRDSSLKRVMPILESLQQNGIRQIEYDVEITYDDVIVYSVYWMIDNDTLVNPVGMDRGGNDMYYMYSGIFAFTLYDDQNTRELPCSIRITYRHSEELQLNLVVEENQEISRVCSFWNETLSLYSTNGCKKINTNSTEISCHCDHTTNFAMLVQVTENKPVGVHENILEYITLIGLTISLVALIATLTIYIFLWELWRCDRNNIHKNLVTCMIVFNGLFLGGADKVENENRCRAIAICLHYSLLCMFTWMVAEAVYIFDKVAKKTPSKWNKLCYYIGACYSIPAVIVGITIVSSIENYRAKDICWLAVDDGAIFAFLVPMYIILLFNFMVLLKAANVIYERSKFKISSYPVSSESSNAPKQKKSTDTDATQSIQAAHMAESQQLKRTLKGMLSLIPIFGLTWLFAMFAFDSGNLCFQYLFTICNSLQGVSIFIVYCLQDKKTMEAWYRKVGRKKRQHDAKQIEKTQSTGV